MNQLDLPSDYKLSKEEFRNLMVCYVGSKDPIDEIIDVFKVFDKNLSAQIGPTELTHVFNKLGLNLTEEESKSLVKEGDNDGDDVVDFHEFISIMISK
jgi:calmodulin